MPRQLRLQYTRVKRHADDPLVAVPPRELVGDEHVCELALVVLRLRRHLLALRGVLERIELDVSDIRVPRGRRDDARVLVRGRLLALEERGEEELGEEEVAHDVRAELHVVPVRSHVGDRRPHHPSARLPSA